MDLTRRSVLVGAGAATTLGKLFTSLENTPLTTVAAATDSVGVSIGVSDIQQFDGLSTTVAIDDVRNPFAGGDDGDQGQQPRNAIHITSRPQSAGRGNNDDNPDKGNGGNGSSDGEESVTFDIALSLLDVSDRDLTIGDLDDYQGKQPGFAYDWAAVEADVVGVDTDHEGFGAPDDVWFFLEKSSRNDDQEPTGGFTQLADSQAVFRTLYADRNDDSGALNEDWEYEAWNTRDVTAEFDASGWKELNLDQRRFERLEDDLVSTYPDAKIAGVGISRGDPYYGPSILHSYYSNLTLAGEQYEFPSTVDLRR